LVRGTHPKQKKIPTEYVRRDQQENSPLQVGAGFAAPPPEEGKEEGIANPPPPDNNGMDARIHAVEQLLAPNGELHDLAVLAVNDPIPGDVEELAKHVARKLGGDPEEFRDVVYTALKAMAEVAA